MAGTKFSDYLGLNHCKKAKKLKHFIHLDLAYWPQSLTGYDGDIPAFIPEKYFVNANFEAL